MTDKELKRIAIVAMIAFALGVILTLVVARVSDPKPTSPLTVNSTGTLGAVGTKTPVEKYIPVIAQSGGYYSDLPMWVNASSTFAQLTVASTTQNGIDRFPVTGNLAQSTTTHLALHNPYRATSTVDVSQISVTTAASTSRNFYIGTSTTPFVGRSGLGCSGFATALACNGTIIDEAIIATSTASGGIWSGSKGTIVGNGGGFFNASGNGGGTSLFPLVVGPNEYVIIYSTSTYSLSDLLDLNDQGHSSTQTDGGAGGDGVLDGTMAGKYYLEFFRLPL
jgi:hypothetical protein